MWRFKTEEEFIAQYGKDWQQRIPSNWNDAGRMDYLYGQEIESKYFNSVGKPTVGSGCTAKRYGIKHPKKDGDSSWTISREMLIEVEDIVKENYEIY